MFRYQLYAFDNHFLNADRHYAADERWDLCQALGYDLAYLSINRTDPESWQGFLDIGRQRRRTGLGLAAVYTVLDFSSPQHKGQPSLEDMIIGLEAGDTLELAISFGWRNDLSAAKHDSEVLDFLAPLLQLARERGVVLSLYPHFGFWLERIEDAVRLASLSNDPLLRVTFCGYHWFAIDGASLDAKLSLAQPWLHLVNICGSRAQPPDSVSPLPKTIEPVGEGDFPLRELLGGLARINYRRPIGFQGYLIGGNPPEVLRRSLVSFRLAEGEILGG